MTKKGIFNAVELAVYFIFVIVAAMFIFFAAFHYLNEEIDTTKLETFILAKKLIYSDSCLALKDEIRVYRGIIDLKRLNSEILINCFTKQDFGYLVKVYSLDGKLIKSASNLNSRQESLLPICKSVKQKCHNRKDIILYYENGKIKTGNIEIEVINLAE